MVFFLSTKRASATSEAPPTIAALPRLVEVAAKAATFWTA